MKPIEFTEKNLQAALPYLAENRIAEIQFSGGTYQTRVIDRAAENDVWCFIQLDDEGLITDCFCSCENEEATCEHLAASWLHIYNGHLHPLHVRFARSLWNQLCRICMRKIGGDINVLQHLSEGKYECYSPSGKRIFVLRLNTKESVMYFRGLTEGRVRETEETSLKFSKLPAEEITLWKEGRPSFNLRYELSFWSDLAKWMMSLQEKDDPCRISFSYSQKEIPNGIEVQFSSLEFRCYISEADLPLIIPSLAAVKSPLAVHSFDEEAIDSIVYDKDLQVLHIHRREYNQGENQPLGQKERSSRLKDAYPIEDWLYVKQDGFYAREQDFWLSHQTIPKESIARVLNDHGKLLERYLVGTKIFREPLKASYTLSFSAAWDLHICCYLQEPGDLQAPGSALFGNWAYLEDEGFYYLEGVLFDQIETVIVFSQLSDFVTRNRVWLNSLEGFHTHLASVDAHLTYTFGDDHVLRFSSETDLAETLPLSKDLGDWIYVDGEGFYAKRHGRLGMAVQPGVEVRPQDLPLFIHMHEDELEHVRGFFSAQSPIKKVGVAIKLQADHTILITPSYHLHSGYHLKDLSFFEDIVYVKGQGFHKLPVGSHLPRRFQQEMVISKEQIPFFISHELEGLMPYIVKMDKRLAFPTRLELEISRLIREEEGQIAASFSYRTDKGVVSLGELLKAKKKGERYLFSDSGMLDLEEPKLQWIWQLGTSQVDASANQIRLSTMEMLRLQASQEVLLNPSQVIEEDNTRELWDSLCHFTTPAAPDYTELKSSLRPYQEVGVNWLWFLYFHGLAGLLCDDMGLGKTHQTMALLAAVSASRKMAGKSIGGAYLVVCPTSVIYHWEDKLAAFLPHFRVCTFYGAMRSLEGFSEKFDLLLTSYGVLRTEHEELSKLSFEVAIYDEVQVAKNHTSMTHRALLTIHAKTRIGLTGTPIENRLRELKALFDVVLPSYMPSESQYREQFVLPIEKQHDMAAKELLAKFIKPFVLRRKKTDVLRDLPEKTEEVAYCDLSHDQSRLYQEALLKARENIIVNLQDDSKPIPYLPLFALLTKLKQICDHPAVALADPANYCLYQSGKWDLFLELLEEARESQQKIVVFSHYLSMMDIIEAHLSANKIGFASIRGGTKNRREELRRFQEDPDCEVFIGSLQAVGLGVDLTAASVVIHYDRWWNAARENQATDRVHRIGQQRGVQVFKLVTKKTLEEHIDRLIAKKGQLMEEIVGSDDENQLKLLGRQEWLELLKMIN